MPKRKAKSKRKYLGAGRTHGHGNKKAARGGGTRGGRGMAGMGKHKFSYVTAYAKDYFGKHGFVRHGVKTEIPVSHIYEISASAAHGKLEKREGKYYYEFRGKILATGSISVPVVVKAICWSKRAEEKIRAVGGEISKIE